MRQGLYTSGFFHIFGGFLLIANFQLLEENPTIKEEVYTKICNALVMEYKTDTIGIDDIQISDEPVPEG